MELLQQLEAWHWLTLGLILFGLETVGIGGFLIGAGLAAIMQAVAFWLFPIMSWQLQLSVFAANTLLISLVYWKYFRSFNQQTDHQQINNRAMQLVGKRITLDADILAGENRIQIADTYWKVRNDENLVTGDRVEVTSSVGMLLHIKKIEL
jgi:membrane protein implicated in regulation of membrane protease activity